MSRRKDFDVRVDDSDVKTELKQARRLARKNVRDGIKAAVEKSALPPAKSKAPSFIRANVAAGSSGGRGFLTFKGRVRFRDAAALLNFGGKRYDVIKPKKAKALKTPWGPRARVRMRGAKYEGKHFLEHGAEAGLPKFEAIVMKEVMHAFDGLPHN